jgi:hypothetical protein
MGEEKAARVRATFEFDFDQGDTLRSLREGLDKACEVIHEHVAATDHVEVVRLEVAEPRPTVERSTVDGELARERRQCREEDARELREQLAVEKEVAGYAMGFVREVALMLGVERAARPVEVSALRLEIVSRLKELLALRDRGAKSGGG